MRCDFADASLGVLLRAGISTLPVPVVQVCRSIGVIVKLINAAGGYSTVVGGVPVVLVSACDDRLRQRWTVAHELGHIVLGHVAGEQAVVGAEFEADAFAGSMLAPRCVLDEIGITRPPDIATVCCISLDDAIFCASLPHTASPAEAAVIAQFGGYISSCASGS